MNTSFRPPISRRERPAKPALTRAGIVATAIEILRAEGLDHDPITRHGHVPRMDSPWRRLPLWQ